MILGIATLLRSPSGRELLYILGVLIVLAIMFLALRRRKPHFFAHAEYWVYLPGDRLPEQDKIMDRMLRANPHPGAPIGPAEGLVFSDVRLHIALVLRSKNPHVFRPDLFSDAAEPTQEILEGLADCPSFAKVRFISEEPLKDRRHLQFLPHAADAIADLGDGRVIYDSVAEKLMTPGELRHELSTDRDATRPALHTRVIWKRTSHGGVAETRGLVKIGLPELATEEMDVDQQVLVKDILEEAMEAVWPLESMPATTQVEVFGDLYTIEIAQPRKGTARVTILKTGSVD